MCRPYVPPIADWSCRRALTGAGGPGEHTQSWVRGNQTSDGGWRWLACEPLFVVAAERHRRLPYRLLLDVHCPVRAAPCGGRRCGAWLMRTHNACRPCRPCPRSTDPARVVGRSRLARRTMPRRLCVAGPCGPVCARGLAAPAASGSSGVPKQLECRLAGCASGSAQQNRGRRRGPPRAYGPARTVWWWWSWCVVDRMWSRALVACRSRRSLRHRASP